MHSTLMLYALNVTTSVYHRVKCCITISTDLFEAFNTQNTLNEILL
jgi:hypothetical protein